MSEELFWTMVWANFFWFIVSLAVITIVSLVLKRVLKKRREQAERGMRASSLPMLKKCPRCQQKLQVCYSCHQPLPDTETGSVERKDGGQRAGIKED